MPGWYCSDVVLSAVGLTACNAISHNQHQYQYQHQYQDQYQHQYQDQHQYQYQP
jgi:hypothetical protein